MEIDVIFGSSRYLKCISLLRVDPSLNVNVSLSKMPGKCQPSNTEQNEKLHSKHYVQKNLLKYIHLVKGKLQYEELMITEVNETVVTNEYITKRLNK